MSDAPASRRLLEAADLPWMLGLMAVGLVLRLCWWSGYGLGDDIIFRHGINHLLTNHTVPVDNQAYRFVWWLPTAFFCRVFGVSEVGLILPILIASVLGIGAIYLLGKQLWGRPGGVIAAALLVVEPLDFAWSTMLASDVIVSLVAGLTILSVLRALAHDDRDGKRRCWTAAGVCLWLSVYAKFSMVLLIPIVGVIGLLSWRRLDRSVLYFIATAGFLLGGGAIVSYTLTGDPIAPYHAELYYQGLIGPHAVDHRLTAPVFWAYVYWLFWPSNVGDFLFSVYPHLVIVLALVGWLFGVRSSLAMLVWFAVVFLGMQANLQRVEGVWISGFRNLRHGHVWTYPIILLLTGYLVGFRARFPRVTHAALAVLLVFSLWQSVSAASKTRTSFADRRQACRFLATLRPDALYADFQIPTWCAIVGVAEPEWRFPPLHSFDPKIRKSQLANVTSGYVVTGGGREPYYGCWDCIIRAEELTPGQWKLLLELPGPKTPTAWRPEALRVWARVGSTDGAGGPPK